MSTESTKQNIPFKRLPKLPKKFSIEFPKPTFYPIDSDTVIISARSEIFKYNLRNNEMELLEQFDSTLIHHHEQFIDFKNNVLYIYGGDHCSFIQLNLNTATLKIGNDNDNYHQQVADCGELSKSVHISTTTRDEIHILGSVEHFKFDCNQQKFIKIGSNPNDTYYTKLTYVPLTKQLMILGGDETDDIYTYKIKETSNQTKTEWKLNENLNMPRCVLDERYYKTVLFVDVIFVFYFLGINNTEIWCLDLLNDKWYKLTDNAEELAKIDSDSIFIHALKIADSNDIHLLSFKSQLHFTINVYDLLSTYFMKDRRGYFSSLIMGYLKQEEKSLSIANIPFELKQLILNYFPFI